MSLLIAPLEALTDALLSDPERRVLLALFSYRGKVTELVFPSLDALSERSNIKDKTRVSKITTSLAKKGWLTKKKKGFTGCNQYTMCMPERLTNLDLETKLAPQTKLDANTNSNLDSDTKYDVGLRDQVQRTHQVTNHINKPIKRKARFVKPDLGELSEFMIDYGQDKTLFVNPNDPDDFLDYYESKDWFVGKSPMKNWQASARKWIRNQFTNQPGGGNSNVSQINQPANNSAPARVRATNAARQAQRERTERAIN